MREKARGLVINAGEFRCPYCDKRWERGGHKEGFVKAAASSHVITCFEVDLFKRGLMVHPNGSMVNWAYAVTPLDRDDPRYPRLRRNFLKRVPLGERMAIHNARLRES